MSEKAVIWEKRLKDMSERARVSSVPTRLRPDTADPDLDPGAAAARRDARVLEWENQRAFAGEVRSTNEELRGQLVPTSEAARERRPEAGLWRMLRPTLGVAGVAAVLVATVVTVLLVTTLSSDPLFEFQPENTGRFTPEQMESKVAIVQVADDFMVVPAEDGVPISELTVNGGIMRRLVEKDTVQFLSAEMEWDFLSRATFGSVVAVVAAVLAVALALFRFAGRFGPYWTALASAAAGVFAVVCGWGVVQLHNALSQVTTSMPAQHQLWVFAYPTGLVMTWTVTLSAVFATVLVVAAVRFCVAAFTFIVRALTKRADRKDENRNVDTVPSEEHVTAAA